MALGQTIFRDNRRRRVLQDETRRANNCVLTPVTEGARYTDAANVENHPQITQFIPRRYRSYALGLTLAAGGIAAIELLHVWADEVAAAAESGPLVSIDLAAGGGLAAWFSSLVLAGVAAIAYIVYSLRKHRVDDYTARYRLWLWVGGAALLASADSVARLHQVWSSLWVSQTGWTALDGTASWLVPLGVFGLWVTLRLVLETAECRGACSFVVAGAVAYTAAACAAVGLWPSGTGSAALIVMSSALLLAHVLALAAVTLYARYVVLDVQGLIPRDVTKKVASKRANPQGDKSAESNVTPAAAETAFPATIPLKSSAAARPRKGSDQASAANPNNAWVDGSETEEDAYEDQGSHRTSKLSKSDRKRVRKQRRQAA